MNIEQALEIVGIEGGAVPDPEGLMSARERLLLAAIRELLAGNRR